MARPQNCSFTMLIKRSYLILFLTFFTSTSRAFVGRSWHSRRFMMEQSTRLATSKGLMIPEKKFLIAPSILSADFARLGEETVNVLKAGADVIHFDVMDNHFVPNLTMGPMALSALRKHGITQPIDVHLMVSPVDKMIEDFAAAGATSITFHPEASVHVDRTLSLIKSLGCKAGLVFNPATPLDMCNYVMDKLDLILLMSVNPGFGGQAFIPGSLMKAREAREMITSSGLGVRLEMDGGISEKNIKQVAEAGVDMFVSGSAIFKEPRTVDAYKQTINKMRQELDAAVLCD